MQALAKVGANARDPIMDDAAVMRRLRQSSRRTLAPRAMAARAAYLAARRSEDFGAWSRQEYVPGTVKGAVVPLGVGTPAAVRAGAPLAH